MLAQACVLKEISNNGNVILRKGTLASAVHTGWRQDKEQMKNDKYPGGGEEGGTKI